MALRGIKVIEMMGLAPGPLCGTILADFGATVTVVQRIQPSPFDVMSNGKKMLSVDLKSKDGVNIIKKLCASSDVLLDTFRPGVMEKLGLGPDLLLKENSRLIYARLTGYGQTGAYESKAGHDINYVAMSGVLSALIRKGQSPHPPLNLLADFAGGSFMCALGILLALFQRSQSGTGQIVDSSMTEGAAYIATWLFKSRKLPVWSGEPGTNALDGGLPCYGMYQTKDGKYMAVGALEPQFYLNFVNVLQLSEQDYPQVGGEHCRNKFEEIFLTKTQDEWCHLFEKADACVTPVLQMDSVDQHKMHVSRKSFYRDSEDILVPEPAPRLSVTPGVSTGHLKLPAPGQHTEQILQELGYDKSNIEDFINKGIVYAAQTSKL